MKWIDEKVIFCDPQGFVKVVEGRCSYCQKVSQQAKAVFVPDSGRMTYKYCPRCGDELDV